MKNPWCARRIHRSTVTCVLMAGLTVRVALVSLLLAFATQSDDAITTMETANSVAVWTARDMDVARLAAPDSAPRSITQLSTQATSVPATFRLVDYYYPIHKENRWGYDSRDDSSAWTTELHIAAVDLLLTFYSGRSPVSTYTRSVDAVVFDQGSGSWTNYMARGALWGYLGTHHDDGDPAVRFDPGFIFSNPLSLGQSSTVASDTYANGVYAGEGTFTVRVIDLAEVTVPYGRFTECLHLAISYTIGGKTRQEEHWWAKGVGPVKWTHGGGGDSETNELRSALLVRPPRITTQPQGGSVNTGSTMSFNVHATGDPTLTYQWRRNGVSLADDARVSGANTSQLTIAGVQTTDAGTYTVVVSNAYGNVTSSEATLDVLPPAELVRLVDYYPLPLGAEWIYEGSDWDGRPAKSIRRVAATNNPVTLYTGRSPVRSYTTNVVSEYNAYVNPSSMVPYDEWTSYMAFGSRFGYFGDNDAGNLKLDGGALLPEFVAVGMSITNVVDAYIDGAFAGSIRLIVQVMEKTSVTVPAGTYLDVLRVRISIVTPGDTGAHDEWWAKSVGSVKEVGVSGDGVLERWELLQATVPSAPTVNQAPSFVKGPDQMVNEDAGRQTVAGWATGISPGPADEVGQGLTFLVSTDQPGWFTAEPTIAPDGTLSYTLAPDVCGVATMTVVLEDDGGTANGGVNASAPQSFTITIWPVNDAPRFVKGPDQLVNEGADRQTIVGWATGISPGPADEAGQALTFLVSTDQPGWFTAEPTIAPDGTLTYAPSPNASGVATMTVVLEDDGGTANGGVNVSAPQTFTITVRSVNDAPSFVRGPDQLVNEDAGRQTVPGWATGISPGPADEAGQALTFLVSTDQPGWFTAEPTLAPDGTLSYALAPDVSGVATMTVVLEDDGGTANGGVNVSAPQTFTITVRSVNDAPSFVKGPDQVVNEDAGRQTVPGWATGISPGPADEAGQALTFLVSTDQPGWFTAEPTLAPDGTLSYALAPDVNGLATITVRLKDDGGTANGGVNASAPQTFTITVRGADQPPRILAVRWQGEFLLVEWSAVPARTYRLEYTDTLDRPQWREDAGDIVAVADRAQKQVERETSAQQRFYRVRLLP